MPTILRQLVRPGWHLGTAPGTILCSLQGIARGTLLLSCWLGGCRASTSPLPPHAGSTTSPGARQTAADVSTTETFHPFSLRQASSALLYLAGSTLQRMVSFEVVDGMAVLDGDILLGPATFVPFRYGAPRFASRGDTFSAVARSSRSDLWTNSEMPYVIESSVGPEKTEWINWAIQHIASQTPLRFRPATSTDQDHVFFRDSGSSSGCYSYLGRIGGPQEIQVGGCGVRGSVVHEILHAAGFYHEQSRGDRDDYVVINWNEIDPAHRSNFEIRSQRGQDIGTYDYSSIMHYSARAFSISGNPTIVPKTPGVSIGQREGLSPLDRAALQQLYGSGGSTGSSTGGGSTGGGSTGGAGGGTPGGLLFPFPWPTMPGSGTGGGTAGGSSFPFPWPVLITPQPTQPAPPPPTQTGPAPWAGNYSSTRGPMACTEDVAMVACSFSENGTPGRLDCRKEQDNLRISCSWMTFFPRPGYGRATFSRQNNGVRAWQGTWGYYQDATNGGAWNTTGQ
ncbi:MAG: M12 family metallopeptidase [Myxococcales bacterium]|nr:M12 family metallopeptidase [Polyangiaceae bacterium]MDW8251837.1 M12 family metallopeptidase [Myxococcales bacterium]